MKIEISLIPANTPAADLGYTHEYLVIGPDGIAVRHGMTKGMTAEKLAGLFAGESIREL